MTLVLDIGFYLVAVCKKVNYESDKSKREKRFLGCGGLRRTTFLVQLFRCRRDCSGTSVDYEVQRKGGTIFFTYAE